MRTKPYGLIYLLHFIMWALQVLRDGQYSTQPLEWILYGSQKSTCRLQTELQPGASQGFLRPCGKDGTNQNLLIVEKCSSDWTDHETAKKCNAYAFYSNLRVNVSNEKRRIQFISWSLRQKYITVNSVQAILPVHFWTILLCSVSLLIFNFLTIVIRKYAGLVLTSGMSIENSRRKLN